MTSDSSFQTFAARKTDEAIQAHIPGYVTAQNHSSSFRLEAAGNTWTRNLFDGLFYFSARSKAGLPSVNLVFVQSKDGNTEAVNPESLGGGNTDKHLIYEGLTRVAADAVLAGAGTARSGQMVFSVWHPELIALRRDLGKPRHPSQIVASVGGNLEVENGLMFNQTEVPVFVLTTDRGKGALAGALSRRPWVHLINMGEKPALEEVLHRLCRSFGIRSISAVGGRTIATALLDAGLVQDLYLTTSPRRGGDPGTPYYTGEQEIKKQLVVRKEGRAEEAGVLFEHFAIDGK